MGRDTLTEMQQVDKPQGIPPGALVQVTGDVRARFTEFVSLLFEAMDLDHNGIVEREEVAILEFTVPVELLDMDVGIGSRYSKAIDDLLGKTTRALNGVKLSSNDVQIASVTM